MHEISFPKAALTISYLVEWLEIYNSSHTSTHPKDRVLTNVGWYNISGQEINFGTLTPKTLRRLMKELPEPLLFLSSKHCVNGSDDLTRGLRRITYKPRERDKGIQYVLDRCCDLLLPDIPTLEGALYRVTSGIDVEQDPYPTEEKRFRMYWINRTHVPKLVTNWFNRI